MSEQQSQPNSSEPITPTVEQHDVEVTDLYVDHGGES